MLRTPHATCIFMSHRVSLVKPSPLQFRALHSDQEIAQFLRNPYLHEHVLERLTLYCISFSFSMQQIWLYIASRS